MADQKLKYTKDTLLGYYTEDTPGIAVFCENFSKSFLMCQVWKKNKNMSIKNWIFLKPYINVNNNRLDLWGNYVQNILSGGIR